MATQVGQTLSAQDFNKTYSVGTTVSPDEFNNLYGNKEISKKQPYQGILHSAINYAKDIGTTLGQRKEAPKLEASLQNAQDMAQRVRARAAIETDPVKKANLLKVAGQNEDVTQGVREQQQGAYSEDINQPYWLRGLKTGADIATTADAVNFLTGSPAIGMFKNAEANPLKWYQMGARSSPSVVTQSINLFNKAKEMLHPLKNTGSKLEAVRTTVEVPKTESESKIFENIVKDRKYQLNPELRKEVETGFQKLISGTNPGKETNNLNEIYQNLNNITGLSDDAKSILSKAVRGYADPLQTQAGIKLSKAYSTLKKIEPKIPGITNTMIKGTIGYIIYRKLSPLLFGK